MSTFYGVYIDDNNISAVLDLVRFLAEPDSLRTSHITLRGPYEADLPSSKIDAWNKVIENRKFIRLDGPSSFFNSNQSTVIIRVDLQDLKNLVKKPDFADAVAHLTLYDGGDRNFARMLLAILHRYDLYKQVPVTKISKLSKKAPLAGEFFQIYPSFRDAFHSAVGAEKSPSDVSSMPSSERLKIIESLISSCFKRYSENLVRPKPTSFTQNLYFDFFDTKRKIG